MNGRTRLLIGLTLIALGIGVVSMGYAGGESSVRYVEDIMQAPQRHSAGTYVLMAVPQPAQVPITGASGIQLADNPAWSNTTSTTVRWSEGTQQWFSTRTVTIRNDNVGTHWTFRNETRNFPSDPEPAYPAEVMEWTTSSGVRVFPIQGFDDGDNDTPRVWGLYSGPVKEAMQPKPSQFTGRLLSTLPDGSPVPEGVYLFSVDEYKAGCSSKFLPPEEKARQEAD